jgi:dienelactone hydrolase
MLPTLLFSATLMTPAADPPTSPTSPTDTAKADEAIHKYLAAETKRLSERFMDGAKTKAEWEAKRPKLKEQFLDMLGLWPLPEKTPLKATVTGTLVRGDVTIDKLHFQSKPGLYVTGNLYRPTHHPTNKDGHVRQLPAILYVCGHSNKGRDGNKTAFQDHGMWFASNGYICLIVDTLQLGEVAGKHHGTYNLGRFWWQDRGYTPAGVECWNGMRAIDYLVSRNDVDRDSIGVTGISGGGASTVWIAAADHRVKVAVPVSGMSDLESYVTNKVIDGHCDCMFFINTYQWEWTTALMLHAPKPLLFANSDNDTIFPMDGNRRVIERLRKGYDLLGKKENVEEYVSKGGHAYRPDLRVAVFTFFEEHMKVRAPGDVGDPKARDADFPKIEGKDLRVFPEDKDLPKDQINDRVDEVFVPKAEVKVPEKKEEFKEWKAGTVKRLEDLCFSAPPIPINGIEFMPFKERGDFPTEPNIRCEGSRVKGTGTKTRTLLVLNPDDEPKIAIVDCLKHLPDSSEVLAVYTRGGGNNRWARKNSPNTVERSMALVGRTVDSGRVWDVTTITRLTRPGEPPVRLVGHDQASIIAAYAILIDPGLVQELVVIDPPTSHRDGPHFLNVDRVLDLPTALGLLAPGVKLTLINAKDPAFDKTAAIYKLAGAADKFERK